MTNSQDPFDAFRTVDLVVQEPIRDELEEVKPFSRSHTSHEATASKEVSELTRRLQELQQRIPVVSDKALIELVNGIQISAESVHYRKSRSFFGRLMDTWSGSDRQRELLIQGNLVEGQTALQQWVLELSTNLNISQVGLEITQRSLAATQASLLEARHAIRSQKQRLDELQHLVQTLSHAVGFLDLRMSAHEDFDRIVTAWMGGRTYTDLPWLVQIVLLVQEVFSSSVSVHELQSGNTQYRQRLIDKLNAELRHLNVPKQFGDLGELLDLTWRQMQSNEDQSLCVSLLETRSLQVQQVINIPYLFTISMAFDLAMLPEIARPNSPGRCAFELCRAQIAELSNLTTPQAFINAIVEETANHCSSVLSLSNSITTKMA